MRKRSHNNPVSKEEPAYGRYETEYAHTHTHRGTKNVYIHIQGNSYKMTTTTFTKGYKVTLYSDSLRATALYAIYINGPNLGYQRG